MKAWQLIEQKGPDGLQLLDLPEPASSDLGPGQVLIRISANSLNFRDLMIASGNYGKTRLPVIPLSDGAGEILALGPGVTKWKTGDRVMGTFFQAWEHGPVQRSAAGSALGGSVDGTLAEQVVISENGIVAIPPHLSFEEAATLPCAALTAWHALVTAGRVAASDTVLLQGTGGVSVFGLQFAKMHGARAIITSSSDDKLARAKSLGADDTINYRTTPAWEEEVHRLTGKTGVQHVIEVGGADTFPRSLHALALGGTISIIGGVSGFTSQVPFGDIIGRSAIIRGIYVGSREMFEAMNIAIARHQLRPAIDRVFPFAEAPAAYRHQATGAHFGKIVISHG
jgi:NADPH:quinone reductase-like Zn-dependent oxidoreductase